MKMVKSTLAMLTTAAVLGVSGFAQAGATLDAVQKQTIQNKRDLEAASEEDQADFRSRLHQALVSEENFWQCQFW